MPVVPQAQLSIVEADHQDLEITTAESALPLLRPAVVRRRGQEASFYEDQAARAGKLFVVRRLLLLLWAAFKLGLVAVFVRVARLGRLFVGRPYRSPADARAAARRFRRALQNMGGTWIKMGQQMSLRTDVLPEVYCDELERLLDNADALPREYVERVLKRTIGGDLGRVFELPFDFEAVGKASVACVYRARLRDGTEVAVKVRRPDIRRVFDADLTALDWFLRIAEYLTVIRPGISRPFRSELRRMLMDELDFRAERHYQELFRRYLKRRKKLRVTAPKLVSDLCSNEVIVSEFVSGLWMKDLLEIVENDDRPRLAELEEQGIRPKKVAQRLIRANHYQFFECPFFHGDPHPANILIQPGSRIVMIDFGACGVFGARERAYLRQMHEAQAREDVARMVSCVIHLMEPLPAVNVNAFRHELEHEWWLGFYGIKSKHSSWQERTSFRLWRELLRLVQKYSIPLPLNVLRMVRATLLYDTIGARIYPRLDVFREYRKYYKQEAKRLRRRINRAMFRQMLCGPDLSAYVMLERLADTSRALFEKVENFANQPEFDLGSMVSKGFATLHIFMKWMLSTVTLTAVALLIFAVSLWDNRAALGMALDRWWSLALGEAGLLNPSLGAVFKPLGPFHLVVTGAWLVVVALLSIKYSRQVIFRISADGN